MMSLGLSQAKRSAIPPVHNPPKVLERLEGTCRLNIIFILTKRFRLGKGELTV